MWDYTDKVKDHFENPRNVGEVDNPDGVGEVGSLACGDALRLTFKLGDDKRILEAKFQTFGCASAIASSSALTEIIKGMTLEEAVKVTNQDIAKFLGGLPEKKMHCSVMGREALMAAIANYRGERAPHEESDVVCQCFGVTRKEIEEAVRLNRLTTVEQVTNYTKAGGGCGNCHEEIERIIANLKALEGLEEPRPQQLTNIQKMKLIEKTLEREIKPALQADGGDIELIDIDGNTVKVALRGTCRTCAASEVTLKQYVQQKLREQVSPELVVEEVR
jgi:NifU-like protein